MKNILVLQHFWFFYSKSCKLYSHLQTPMVVFQDKRCPFGKIMLHLRFLAFWFRREIFRLFVCWKLFIKPRPNDRNISTQHIATLLGATCYMRLATLLRCVAKCCDMSGVVGSNLKLVKFFMQHFSMLLDVVVVRPGSCNNVAPGHAR